MHLLSSRRSHLVRLPIRGHAEGAEPLLDLLASQSRDPREVLVLVLQEVVIEDAEVDLGDEGPFPRTRQLRRGADRVRGTFAAKAA